MRVKIFPLFVIVLVCAFAAAAQTVIESESSVVLNEKTADVSLVLDSKTRARRPVEFAILGPDGNTRATFSQTANITPGKRKYKFAIPIGDLMKKAGDEIAWYRLQYRVGDANGIASLSELMKDDFDLRAAAFERVIPGQPMRIRIRSLNPFTEAVVKGVMVKVKLTIDLDTDADEDELKLEASTRTNGDGFASVDFKIPENIKFDGDADLEITGQKNGVIRKIEEDLDDDGQQGTVLLTTDKPLYQPGQAFNVRALYIDSNNTIVPDSELEFTIEDEDDTVVSRQTVKTSAFGIAAISWQIPDNAKLGSYRVKIEADSDLREDQLSFKVSRYDLPNFSVTAKPDKSYYLPSDREASITINADYLFGKPVTQGKVRVVQESDRHWNYYTQKYEANEGDFVEGPSDASGKYVAKFDLKREIAELQSSQWQRYKDISYSAYFTDLTTNRTEQRRFDIRLSKEPIHIYLIRYSNQHRDLPLTAYVSTFYADGTPAFCNVEIRDVKDTITHFKTNSIGAGKFEIEIPPESIRGSEYEIRITARDKKGQQGTFDESFYLSTDDAIQIRTNQAIYKPGDMVEVDLLSTQKSGFIYVDVVKQWTPVDSQTVALHNGKAHLSIPYKPSFKGDVIISAYSDKEEGRWSDRMRANRGVVFPEQQNLILNAKFSKNEFRPNEEALVRFAVFDGLHNPIESAIGLGIFDKAVEERARTETEFGGYFSRFYRLMGYERSFGNFTLKDINDLDMSRPVSPEMQLAAEIMLSGGWYYPAVYHSGNLDTEAKTLYSESITKQLKPLDTTLNSRYAKDFEHPVDLPSLRMILAENGIDFARLLDPWGNTYFPEFSVNRIQDIITLKTAGADEKIGTPDDFNAYSAGFNYFTKTGEAIDRAMLAYKNRTGGYIRDLQTLTNEVAKADIDLSKLKDRWGRGYRILFEVSDRYYVVRVYCLGPNGYEDYESWRSDDFDVWRNSMDYFGSSDLAVNRILDEEVNIKKKPFPRDEKEFVDMLRRNKLDIDSIKDGYGRSVYVTGEKETRYTDKTKIDNGKTTITPVTEEMMIFKLRSYGPDGYVNNNDSDLAKFSGAVTEAHKGTGFAKVEVKTVPFSGAKGAIRGTVVDPNGAVIAGADVTAIDEADESKTYSTKTDSEGSFLLGNLPSGRYRVKTFAANFKASVSLGIEVRSQAIVEMKVTLQVGTVQETVAVTAEALSTVDASSAAVSNSVTKSDLRIKFNYKEQTSTPRLREYFPETLVWQPELLTDKRGRAELNFKMADNITTWKMFAIASTKKGKIGVVEKEITAFQPFFVDLDPPKFLTEGDEIYLPTQVRNYTDKKQKVDVTMDKADWFSLLNADKRQVDVAAGDSQNAVFGFKTVTPVKDGKQRVTAIAQTDSDAIEKPVTVRPNGEEIVQTNSNIFTNSEKFTVNFPANALPKTQKAELKIYPNLYSHVAESVEGLLQRPYGCGEQTISSTYPNLMVLKFAKPESVIAVKAKKYLQKGYERLLGYQVADGGFSYWGGKDSSDIGLTAYALRFLTDASSQIDVDPEVINKAQMWLLKQQRADGGWTQKYRWENHDDPSRAKITTTYVARALAMVRKFQEPARDKTIDSAESGAALAKALTYLKTRNAEIDEPYAMALFGLASLDSGDSETAATIAKTLASIAIPERNTVYWKLETNTPFYGWGTAGRIETTALVTQLLIRVAQKNADPQRQDLISKATLFLLKNKDRYGVWYSTQTTINVLDAFLASLGNQNTSEPQKLEVMLNGQPFQTVDVAPDRIEAVTLDLTGKLNASTNNIEVRSSNNSPLMSQLVASHYIDWKDSVASNVNVNQSRALRLDYKCDKQNAAIMDEVSCSVSTERIGFQGYGMLLAEIGTPPGADVSRESLEKAIESDWSISRYEILPDRIVVYMWSKAGGSSFSFKFRPRYGINAQTPASIVYDYYNPEAQAIVAPLTFKIK